MTLPEPLGLDTDVLIYLSETVGPRRDFLDRERIGSGHAVVACTSVVAELLVGKYRRNDERGAQSLLWALATTDGLTIVPISLRVAETAARVRAEHNIELPDALNVAAAIVGGAVAFLTNDARLANIGDAGIPILRLDDLVADSPERKRR